LIDRVRETLKPVAAVDRVLTNAERTLELPGGGVATVEERMPALATARLCDYRHGNSRLGGLASAVDVVARAGAPIEVLREPGGSGLAVDWAATLRHPPPR
jgi:hypothetical protein